MGGRFVETLYSGKVFQGFEFNEILFEAKTPYQAISIYQTDMLGRVLVLDGVIQTTEADEFIYHEMLTHIPLFSIDGPERILVVGGGDGGTVREALKHPVKQIDLVEIDQGVIDSCRTFMPTLNDAGKVFDHPRVNVVVQDAFEYMKNHRGEYDAILIDSTDPIGMAEALYSNKFYQLCFDSLSSGGVISAQDGVVFFQRDEAASTISKFRELGLFAGAYTAAVPTYYGGLMTFGISGYNSCVLAPNHDVLEKRHANLEGTTRHYSPKVHVASFVMPPWIKSALDGV